MEILAEFRAWNRPPVGGSRTREKVGGGSTVTLCLVIALVEIELSVGRVLRWLSRCVRLEMSFLRLRFEGEEGGESS